MLALVLFFVLGLPVIVLIKDSVKKRKRELEKEKSRQKLTPKNNQTIIKIPPNIECLPKLEHILDLFFNFADKNQDRIVNLLLTPPPSAKSNGHVAIEIIFILDGRVERYINSETEELFSYFKQLDNDSFCKVGYTLYTNQISNNFDHSAAMIQAYIKDYRKKHPNRNFVLESFGASISIWNH